jgi:hypothetical protein
MVLFVEKANLKEMAIMSSRTDADLDDIDSGFFQRASSETRHYP